ncbi:hypothetical protein GCM10011344_25100 [Dokdonia pacifica]|uniref:SMI1 / KNR4 family (SUKH-1) n=1 Tax=Dokdonia pacifica TaxID=1627892 RepID=A0A238WT70_9FLAO|nr:hypothetical protein [Dokdonia pacifica]GGG23333.1 hypothetical protein GCM10011344_25100 [Dokdonia pacifica]SNR48849.1 hypothetical protein SAMN06265376_1011365 [Dokdonia pacifica]
MKTKEEIENWFFDIYDSIVPIIRAKEKILDIDSNYGRAESQINDTQEKIVLDQNIIAFYNCNKFWKSHWKTKSELNFKAEGTFDFITFERVMSNSWDDDLGGNDWAPDMKGFRPLDLFYDSDGFVGFYVEREDKKGLYLVHSDSSVSPLHIDFEGYLKLLSISRGFGWWQNALVEISTGKHQPNVDSFKENMPKIFPDFKYEEFKELYESLRIDK